MPMEIIISFLERHNLPWLLWALLSWTGIRLTCSREQFWYAFPVGVWTTLVGSALEHFFIVNKLWVDRFVLIPVGQFDLFVAIGPFFTLGVLLIRFLPESASRRFFTVLILSATAVLGELISVAFGFLKYNPGWGPLDSLIAYYLGLMSALGFYLSFYAIRQTKW
ncbi:MAG: hypothetical protein SCK29_12070 [Bacillota bacterium]|nr:hypothetical protein [Bacillota bacterium]MDW7684841.1 hypothetical protein [Bacillota bacterium]